MAATSNATPLIALDAVVIDTETTGLDPAKARIVEIAAVRLAGGRLDPATSFRSLVRPDAPIPAAATAHPWHRRIRLLPVRRGFADVWPEFSAYVGDAVVIGHSIGFDLAVLKRECERAAVPWSRPRTLDTRLLAEVAEPELAGYSLDDLASWLGVEIVGPPFRTRRCDDRRARLHRARAEAARRQHPHVGRGRAGLPRADEFARSSSIAPAGSRRSRRRAGPMPNARSAASTAIPIAIVFATSCARRRGFSPPDVALGDALVQMIAERISSLFVHPRGFVHPKSLDPAARRATDSGIITERDALRALAEHGAEALAMPVDRFMSKPLAVVPAEAFVYRAIGRMNRLKVRHLGVVDEAGLRHRGAVGPRSACGCAPERRLRSARRSRRRTMRTGSAAAWAKLPHVVAALIDEGVPARDIAGGDLARARRADRAKPRVMAEQRMRAAGHGAPPCPYALAVLGSAGRGESLLAMDQDNALVFAEGAPDGPEDRVVRGARRPHRRHPARGRRALLQGRRDGEESAMARLGRDLARAHRATGSADPIRRICSRSTFSSTCGRCTATAASPRRSGARHSTPPGAGPRFAKLLAEAAGGVERGARLVRAAPDRGRAASISRGPGCSASSAPRACSPSAIMWWSARRRRGSPA